MGASGGRDVCWGQMPRDLGTGLRDSLPRAGMGACEGVDSTRSSHRPLSLPEGEEGQGDEWQMTDRSCQENAQRLARSVASLG